MAAVAGVRSVLNPNAPAFIPVALRRVEEFSPEWWNLVQTSPWYRDYWLSEHQESFDADRDENEEEDVFDLLPESIDFGFDSEIGGFEAAFEEFVDESEDSDKKEAEVKVEAKALIRNLSLPKSPKEKSLRSFTIKFDGGKTAKFVGPQPRALRRIQQPR